MSLIDRFSVSYNKEKDVRPKNMGQSFKTINTEVLGDDVVDPLVRFGFNIDQIMMAFKIYKFKTVDEAVYILMKDSDTGKYNHRHLPKEEGKYYSKLSRIPCYICGEYIEEHIYSFEEYSTSNMKVEPLQKKEIHDISLNLDNSNNPIIKSSDVSNILSSNIRDQPQVLCIKEVEVPQEILDMFDNPEVCRICFNEIMNYSNSIDFDCGHKFCKTCVTNHLVGCINNGKVMAIKCLSGGCPRTFSDDDVKSIVSQQIFTKYKRFKHSQSRLIEGEADLINCPFPDCEEVVENDFVEEDFKKECGQGHRFCSNCKSLSWHKKANCKNYDEGLFGQIKKISENYKQCPQCRVIIEKNEGCNQMKCINCELEFCWLCMKKYTTDHYALYNFTGCPGMRLYTPEKKKLCDNKYIKSLWFIFSFFLGILAFVLLIAFFAFFGCCYEFLNCYFNRGKEEDFERDDEASVQVKSGIDNPEEITEQKNNKCVIAILIAIGILCQPLYLLFYVLYAMMECYRRFGCWFYYADY